MLANYGVALFPEVLCPYMIQIFTYHLGFPSFPTGVPFQACVSFDWLRLGYCYFPTGLTPTHWDPSVACGFVSPRCQKRIIDGTRTVHFIPHLSFLINLYIYCLKRAMGKLCKKVKHISLEAGYPRMSCTSGISMCSHLQKHTRNFDDVFKVLCFFFFLMKL